MVLFLKSKYLRLFFCLLLFAGLLLCPFGNCFGIFAEATYGTMWAIAESAGVSISSFGLTVGSSEWNEFNENLWGDLDIGNLNYLQSDGSITVSAEDYNAVLDRLAVSWGSNSPSFKPSLLNSQSTFYNSYDWSSDPIMLHTAVNGFPSEVLCNTVADITSRSYQFSLSFDVETRGLFTAPSIPQTPSITPYNTVIGYYLYNGGDRVSFSAPYTKSLDPGNYQLVVRCKFVRSSSDPLPNLCGYLPINGFSDILSSSTLSTFTPPASDYSAIFTVKPEQIGDGDLAEIVNGAAAITARKMHDVLNKTVTLTPILPNGSKPLQGLPWVDVNEALEEGFFDSVHDVVQTTIGDGVLNPSDDEDTSDLIYGEVSWIRRILQKIDSTLDSIKTAVLSLVNGNGDGPPPAILQPPDWLTGGGEGIAFSIGGIWHYVLSFVGSLGAGLGLFATVWAGLPSAMVVPIYAAAVVVIVVGLFKRYIA